MKKILFIDRDGTLVIEPPTDFQVDSLEKLTYYPQVFQWLSRIVRELDYELVMVTNQDGLGTNSFSEKNFWPAQHKIIEAFKNEGITFSNILIDKSTPEENKDTRKPNTGMLKSYLNAQYDLANSYVIGDRQTDVQLAINMQTKSIYLSKEKNEQATFTTDKWEDIYNHLKAYPRQATINRCTTETDITVSVNLNGNGKSLIDTGLGFFNHMLDQIAKHAQLDLDISVKGDLNIDEHHTIEDVAICLGQAIHIALGSKKGIDRYGFLLPMDDCLAQVAIDFGGRPWLVWQANFAREKIGDMPTEMFMHFFKSFSDNAKCNVNIKAEGENEHHKIEAIFKAFAKALKMAVALTNSFNIPSTKGTL